MNFNVSQSNSYSLTFDQKNFLEWTFSKCISTKLPPSVVMTRGILRICLIVYVSRS